MPPGRAGRDRARPQSAPTGRRSRHSLRPRPHAGRQKRASATSPGYEWLCAPSAWPLATSSPGARRRTKLDRNQDACNRRSALPPTHRRSPHRPSRSAYLRAGGQSQEPLARPRRRVGRLPSCSPGQWRAGPGQLLPGAVTRREGQDFADGRFLAGRLVVGGAPGSGSGCGGRLLCLTAYRPRSCR